MTPEAYQTMADELHQARNTSLALALNSADVAPFLYGWLARAAMAHGLDWRAFVELARKELAK